VSVCDAAARAPVARRPVSLSSIGFSSELESLPRRRDTFIPTSRSFAVPIVLASIGRLYTSWS